MRSACAFCHGERGAVMTSVTRIAATRLLKTEPYEASRSFGEGAMEKMCLTTRC
jgi:hypothetical protein